MRKLVSDYRLKQDVDGDWYLRHKRTGRNSRVRAKVAIEELLREECIAIHRRLPRVTTYKLSARGRRAIVGE